MFVGAGSAGCGIAELIVLALKADGIDEDIVRSHIFLVDKNGLVLKDTPALTDFQYRLAHARENLTFSPDGKNIAALVNCIRPSILIGISGVPGLKCIKKRRLRNCFNHIKSHLVAEVLLHSAREIHQIIGGMHRYKPTCYRNRALMQSRSHSATGVVK